MSKQKLLIVASTFPRWEQDKLPLFVYELARSLLERYDVHVLAPHFRGAKTYEVLAGVKVHRFRYTIPAWEILTYRSGGLNNLKQNPLINLLVPLYAICNLLAMFALLIRFRFKIINVHWLVPSGFLALLLKPFFGFKLVITSHGGDIYGFSKDRAWGKLIKLFIRTAIRYSDKLTVVSSAIEKVVLQKFAFTGVVDKLTVIPMGIDYSKFSKFQRARSFSRSSQIKLLFIGRLAEKKGVPYLLNAVKELSEKGFDISCTIIGDGQDRRDLEQLSESLQLTKRVTFLGYVANDELPNYIAQHDILVGPSIQAAKGDREGLPVVFMEAMAAGIPIIVSDTDGVTDLVTNKVTGLIVPQKDAGAIFEAVKELVENPKLVHNLVSSASQVAKNYDWKLIAERFHATFVKN